MLLSSFILEITRGGRARWSGMRAKGNLGQEIISRKVQTPKIIGRWQKQEVQQAQEATERQEEGANSSIGLFLRAPRPSGPIVRCAEANYGAMRACETQGPELSAADDVTLNRFPPLTNSGPAD